MISTLRAAQKENTILSVFFDRDRPDFANVGRVIACDENYTLLSSISTDGRWDGFLLRRTDNIFKIESESLYEKKIMLLNKKRGNAEGKVKYSFWQGDDLFKDMISLITDAQLITGMALEDSEEIIFGKIINENIDCITISILDEYGFDFGRAIVKKNDIDFIEIESINCQTLKYLTESSFERV